MSDQPQQFNAGEYFEQHVSFEHAWRAEPGPVRQLYQGLLLIGVAFLQIQRRNEAGARKTFQRARQYLVALPDVCQGVDVALSVGKDVGLGCRVGEIVGGGIGVHVEVAV